ncbi:MAG: hypothetical protein JW709_12005 [Sedimentisphaerales bacterium]|nr:hypothetical protein [Sedimentisphaerales bacterium]
MKIFDASEEEIIRPRLLRIRIIVIVIMMGELGFCAIVLYLRRLHEPGLSTDSTIWPFIAGGLCFAALAVLVILRLTLGKILAVEQPLEGFIQRFLILGIFIPQAICEGVAIFCLISIILGAELKIMLPIFAGIFLVQLLMFPTRGRFESVYAKAEERRMLKKA